MNLLALTHPDLVFINPPHRTPEALIRWLAEPLVRRNVIGDQETFIQSVLQRESEGPTALGEALAVPHGKTETVHQAAFCLALKHDPIRTHAHDTPEHNTNHNLNTKPAC